MNTSVVSSPTIVSNLAPAAMPPPQKRASVRHVLFGDMLSATLTLLTIGLLATVVPRMIEWAILSGVWSGDGEACRAGGACWAFLREKFRQILFGIYPPGEHWRPALVVIVIVGLVGWSLAPTNWRAATAAVWVATIAAVLALMGGGFFGLTPVPTASWGGLPVTLLLTVTSLGVAFPLAIVLALGRQSELKIVSWFCVGMIEIVRGLPLISLLFIASILLPLMLPEGVSIDKLFRAWAALTIFSAAYLAEIVRGGLQGLHTGQREAARALGLSWLQMTRLIVLPQALRKVIPPLTNTLIVMVKNTSLVLIVGLFDLLSSGRAAATDPAWPAPYVETYLFVASLYFVICFSISRYSLWLESRLAREARQ
ncbi:MAG: amino acid ABC transporter permease [Beijerinckiaceae bacterium]